jgi:hypothetical protein
MKKTLIIGLFLSFLSYTNSYGQGASEFFNLQWRNGYYEIEEAHEHDEIAIRFETRNIPDNEKVDIEIWYTKGGILMDMIDNLDGTIKNNVIEINWVVEFNRNNRDTNYAREIEEIGYAIIDYIFIVKYNNINVYSKPLAILSFVYMQVFDFNDNKPIKYSILTFINSDGEIIKVESDENGYVLIKNIRRIRFAENYILDEVDYYGEDD